MVRPPFRGAVRLSEICVVLWPHIQAHYYQIDLLRTNPVRLLNLVYAWLWQNTDPEKRDQIDTELVEPLDWEDPSSEEFAEIESESFFAAQKALTGGG